MSSLVKVLDFASDEGIKYAHYLYETGEGDPKMKVHENLLNPIQWYVAMELIDKELNNQKSTSQMRIRKKAKPARVGVSKTRQTTKRKRNAPKVQNVPKQPHNLPTTPLDDDQKVIHEEDSVQSKSTQT